MKQISQLMTACMLTVILGGLVMGPAYAQSTTSPGYYSGGGGGPVPPDSDGDGIDDGADSCPSESGPAQNAGCPVHGLDGFTNCVQQGYATSSVWEKAGCAAGIAAAGLIAGAIFAGSTPIAVSGALAAWAPLASIVAGAAFGLLCACFIAWMG